MALHIADLSRTPSPALPATLDISQPFEFIESATGSYAASHDEIVCLRVKDQLFKVSRSRLTMRSPVFRDMFTLPSGGQEPAEEVVELHSDPQEFKDFLWFIHADPLAGDEFRRAVPTQRKCSALLGIASTAHAYEAVDVANWAMRNALSILMDIQRPFPVDSPLAAQLLRTAARFQEEETRQFLSNARDIVCDAINPDRPGMLSEDPVAAVLTARTADDSYVLAHAYFYVLQKGNEYWRTESRLSALDRRRLLSGGFVLGQRRRRTPTHTVYRGWGEPVLWEALVHADILDCRDELWSMFDCDPWNLLD